MDNVVTTSDERNALPYLEEIQKEHFNHWSKIGMVMIHGCGLDTTTKTYSNAYRNTVSDN